jgi:hypothetical protein
MNKKQPEPSASSSRLPAACSTGQIREQIFRQKIAVIEKFAVAQDGSK